MSAPVKCGTPSRYAMGCRCQECRSAVAEYARKRNAVRRAWVAEHGLPRSIEHGISAYNNWGCRCEECRAAWAEYQRDYYRRKRQAVAR